MNKQQRALARLEKIVEQDLPDLEKMAILPHGAGYTAFGVYDIQPHDGLYSVSRRGNELGVFGSLRTALSWCIFDKNHQINKAMTLAQLDHKKIMLDNDIAVRRGTANRITDSSRQQAADTKVRHRMYQLDSVKMNLDKYISLAKYWQTRGFNNETARTGRTASARTSR
jgi:hypothetical protein